MSSSTSSRRPSDAEHGENAWDSLLDTAGLTGAYTSLGTYPDEDMAALVTAACQALGVSQEDLLRHLGRQGFGRLSARNPDLMTEFSDSRSLLLGLNSVIHPEVRKVYPGADVPVFEVVSGEPDSVSLSYRSKRGLCHFAEGLALGVGDLFGETLDREPARLPARGRRPLRAAVHLAAGQPVSEQPPDADLRAQLARVQARLERERAARRESEDIAESTLRRLYLRQVELDLLSQVTSIANSAQGFEAAFRGCDGPHPQREPLAGRPLLPAGQGRSRRSWSARVSGAGRPTTTS